MCELAYFLVSLSAELDLLTLEMMKPEVLTLGMAAPVLGVHRLLFHGSV